MTSSKLPLQLHSIKRKLGLTLIKFEDASVDLKPFVKNHSFESSKFFLHSILKHYKDVSSKGACVINIISCFEFDDVYLEIKLSQFSCKFCFEN